jgi:hypothetical protein
VKITDEMRQAVHAEDCAAAGHLLDFGAMMTYEQVAGRSVLHVGSPDELQLPHIRCTRCTRVWIVFPAEGWGYEDAERVAYGVLRADVQPARDIVRNRGKRERRDRPPRHPDELTPAEPAETLAAEEPVRPERSRRA